MSKLPKSKVVSIDQAMEHCYNGMTVMIPGFVNCGVPETLIKALIEKGITDLDVISNNTSVKGRGIGRLVHEGRIKHITCSHIGSNTETVEKVVAGEINVTFTPQGTLCERMRAGGAGIGGILTPTGLRTPMQEGKQVLEWNEAKGTYQFVTDDDPVQGKRFILELPLHANVALIHAWKADKMGNLIYRRTARNFNPIMATAADFVIVEAEEIVEVGMLEPDYIMTPGCLVNMIVQGAPTESK
jgi:acetate CoA/acetoacetate CoA-transferase alpha subunit